MLQTLPQVKTSIAWLQSRLLTPERAIDNLSGIASMGRCLEIFEHFFPRELDEYRTQPITQSDVRTRIVEHFHELVATKLFPIMDYWSDEDCSDRFDLQINPYPQTAEWWETDPTYYDDLTRAILVGAGMVTEDGEVIASAYEFPWLDLEKLSARTRPLCRLKEAVEILALRTGNDFLDMDMESMYSGYVVLPEWRIDTVEALAQEWKDAQIILGRWHQLMIWASGNEKRLQRIRSMVADAVAGTEEKVRIRI